MGRRCTVCDHSRKADVDMALTFHLASYRVLARYFKLGEDSLQRHERTCLRSSWEQSKELQAMLSAENLLDKLGKWHERMEQQYTNADAAGNIGATVATARTGIAAIESFAHIGVISDVEERLTALENGGNDSDSDDDDSDDA